MQMHMLVCALLLITAGTLLSGCGGGSSSAPNPISFESLTVDGSVTDNLAAISAVVVGGEQAGVDEGLFSADVTLNGSRSVEVVAWDEATNLASATITVE